MIGGTDKDDAFFARNCVKSCEERVNHLRPVRAVLVHDGNAVFAGSGQAGFGCPGRVGASSEGNQNELFVTLHNPGPDVAPRFAACSQDLEALGFIPEQPLAKVG